MNVTVLSRGHGAQTAETVVYVVAGAGVMKTKWSTTMSENCRPPQGRGGRNCQHTGSIKFRELVHPQMAPCLYCDSCNKVFDPQELVSALVFYADKVIGVNTEEGSIELINDYGKRARKALGWEGK